MMAALDWGSTDLHPKVLRGVLGSYPTGVAIVATRCPDGRKVGLTINSFASLSLDPPLVLWSLVNRSPNLAAFRDCDHFTISVLACGQEALARRFADPAVADKFEGAELHEVPEGVPAIAGAVATRNTRPNSSRWSPAGLCWSLAQTSVATAPAMAATPLVFHAGRFTALT